MPVKRNLARVCSVVFVIAMILLPGYGLRADNDQQAAAQQFDRKNALAISQAAIGNQLGDYAFYTSQGEPRRLNGYRGKPLVISMIYTSCYHICPTTTQHLADVVRKARDALGDDSFQVVTIGFDTASDTADAMRNFARQQDVAINGWEFLCRGSRCGERACPRSGISVLSKPKRFRSPHSEFHRRQRRYRGAPGVWHKIRDAAPDRAVEVAGL